MEILEVAEKFGIAGLIVCGSVWLINSISKQMMDKNLQSHELLLNKQLEEFKTQLLLMSDKSSKLHDKRLDKIHELYSLLFEFSQSIHKLVAIKNITGMKPEDIEKEKLEDAQNTFSTGYDFAIFYEKNKLYFNQETCDLIEEIHTTLKDCQWDLTLKYQWRNMSFQLLDNAFSKAKKQLDTKVPELKKLIENNFRKILGVD